MTFIVYGFIGWVVVGILFKILFPDDPLTDKDKDEFFHDRRNRNRRD